MTLLAGRYHVGQEIASGGMAIVHRADDRVLKRPVAVKILAPESASNDTFRDAVHREALAAANLSHPNIVRIYDYGETTWHERDLPFVVMELVDGQSLSSHLKRNGPLPWRAAASICAQVAAALSAAHDRGVVHRDVKPGNIMLTASGVKMVDFGMAAATGDDTTDPTGRVWGTPSYLAPEQLRSEPAAPAADVYALGLVLHACLTGQPAWSGSNVGAVMIARACSPTPRLPETPDIPKELAGLHRRCLAPSPRKRPTARQAAGLLRDLAVGRSAAAPKHMPNALHRLLTRTAPTMADSAR